MLPTSRVASFTKASAVPQGGGAGEKGKRMSKGRHALREKLRGLSAQAKVLVVGAMTIPLVAAGAVAANAVTSEEQARGEAGHRVASKWFDVCVSPEGKGMRFILEGQWCGGNSVHYRLPGSKHPKIQDGESGFKQWKDEQPDDADKSKEAYWQHIADMATGAPGQDGQDGVSGYEVVAVEERLAVGSHEVVAECPEGRVAIGGGYELSADGADGANTTVQQSQTGELEEQEDGTWQGTSWVVRATIAEGGGGDNMGNVKAVVNCAAVTTSE